MAGMELKGDTQDNDLIGGSGDDTLYGGGGSDILLGLDGDDKLYSSLRWDPVTGTWLVDDKGDIIDGGNGNDLLQGGVANDWLIGGAGDDRLYGAGGGDKLQGGAGDDLIQSGKPWNPATDQFSADLVGDTLDGGDGNDALYAEDGADVLGGGDGDDQLYAGGGNDSLYGGAGNDTLYGEAGADTLDGGSGSNRLYGGLGNDTYVVHSATDVIWDEGGTDRAFVYADWVLPSAGIESWTWAPGVQQLPNWIAALAVQQPTTRLSATTKIVDYHFAQQPAAFFDDEDRNGFQPFNEAQRVFTRQVFDYVSSVLNVQFRETAALDAEGVLVMANNYQPDSAGYASSRILMLDTGVKENLAPSFTNAGVQILLHELGHALGLKHPFEGLDAVGTSNEGPFLSSAEDTGQHTLMSYDIAPSDYHLSYNALDLAALQYIYGPTRQVAAGDTVWTLDAHRANFIADGAGSDTIDGSAFGGGMTLDLRSGYWGFMGAKADSIVEAGQVTVNFGSAIENLRGGAGNDSLTGNELANRIEGGAGDDILSGGAGSDQLDGGAGLDVATYAGKRADFQVRIGQGGSSVASLRVAGELDTLSGIERLRFDDAMVTLDVDGVAGQAYRLYQAAFNRTPDLAGLGYWIGRMEGGASLNDVASAFIASNEFVAMYGARPAHGDFLGKIYQNILHRAPDQAGFDYWLNAMDHGTSATDILAMFSQSQENTVALAGVLANGIAYTPFA
jgi:Ca2+-binding RTX toxin-like protein